MTLDKKNLTVVAFLVIASLGLGFAVGFSLTEKNSHVDSALDQDTNFAPTGGNAAKYADLSDEELGGLLSTIMLPDDEYEKLRGAIHKTAVGLFMSQAQGFNEGQNEQAVSELRTSIDEKYSRKYFTEMNANSMKELSKNNLISILSFYDTEAGQKFLTLSPKIIESTMYAVQADLGAWLPVTVETLITKIKNPNAPVKPSVNADAGKTNP